MIHFHLNEAKVFYDLIKEFGESKGITHLAFDRIINLSHYLRFNIFAYKLDD